MDLYPLILVIHILSAVIWLGVFPAQLVIGKALKSAKGTPAEGRIVSLYLFLLNIAGIIGMTGILITGIYLVFILPYYSFFSFSANHWLATKQVLMVILALLVFVEIIPTGKKVRGMLNGNLDIAGKFNDEFYSALGKLSNVSLAANILVLFNFLLAITHRFIG